MNREEFLNSLVEERDNSNQLSVYELAALVDSGQLNWNQLTNIEKHLMEEEKMLEDYVHSWKLSNESQNNQNSNSTHKASSILTKGLVLDLTLDLVNDIGLKEWKTISLHTKTKLTQALFRMKYGFFPGYFKTNLAKTLGEN